MREESAASQVPCSPPSLRGSSAQRGAAGATAEGKYAHRADRHPALRARSPAAQCPFRGAARPGSTSLGGTQTGNRQAPQGGGISRHRAVRAEGQGHRTRRRAVADLSCATRGSEAVGEPCGLAGSLWQACDLPGGGASRPAGSSGQGGRCRHPARLKGPGRRWPSYPPADPRRGVQGRSPRPGPPTPHNA